MDTVRAAEANGYPVPKEFDAETRVVMENAICHEWFGAYCESLFAQIVSGEVGKMGRKKERGRRRTNETRRVETRNSLPPFLPPTFSFEARSPADASNEFRTLAMGPLLSGLSRDMNEWVTASTKGEGAVEERAKITLKKFSVLSCHDTTLAGMLASLDCFDHK